MAQNANTIESPDVNIMRKTKNKSNNAWKKISKNYELYIFILPALLYFLIFHYGPMYGIQIAFKNYIPTKGIWGSSWVGMKHFNYFFKSYYFKVLIKNTVSIALYSMAAGFPIPIILALLLNELKNERFKKLVQNVTYAPHFISTVVLVGMIFAFLSPSNGIVNEIIKAFGGEPIPFMSKASMFKSIYVWTGVWQNAGWSSIIYLAALSSIDPQLHEAAIVDGATKLQRIRHINIPGIMPTMVIILILNSGTIMNVGFEKVFLMQNSLNMESSDVISTYVYRTGLLNAQYSFSSAVGFFNSVINFTLLVIVNNIAKRLNETSLW
ncbi:MAG: sugar ABC transporter permease [Firmicutes bacterium]|nr:sugar ABC transporter permease [Bacillota bacterium]